MFELIKINEYATNKVEGSFKFNNEECRFFYKKDDGELSIFQEMNGKMRFSSQNIMNHMDIIHYEVLSCIHNFLH